MGSSTHLAQPVSQRVEVLRPTFTVVRGTARILAYSHRLLALARGFGLVHDPTYLTYFLSVAQASGKRPCLLLRTDQYGTVDAAALFFEYTPFGLPSGIFVPSDFAGQRDIIAPAAVRAQFARQAAEFLIRQGANLVLVTLQDARFTEHMHPLPGVFYGTATRTVARTLTLAATLDDTLASLGSHTRRNLRHFRRRALAELGVTFHDHADLSEAEFLDLTRHSLYPARTAVARWRYRTGRTLPGTFFAGLRAADGRWLSIVGGRHQPSWTSIDWQTNVAGHQNLSIGTVMRSFLIEQEVRRGARCITFEGGTTHSMNRSFQDEQVHELVLTRSFLSPSTCRKVLPRLLPHGNLLAQSLLHSGFHWRGPVSHA